MKLADESRNTGAMGAPVRVGDVLADKYEVTRIIGMGGMGVVVAARHRELDKLVALKFMHEEMSSNEQATERFLREARAAARLQNEHVGHVLDVGRLANRVPYIVMEYLEGQDLGQLVENSGPLDVADAVEYVLQACEAMAEAHVQGIIHRDLKPQNLFLTTRQDGRRLVKVLDFGISKAQFSRGPTSTQQAMGSPAYMAPEQMRSARSVDARADIWSLGVILYYLLSNTLPFTGDTIPEVMFNVLSNPAPPLAGIRSGLPPDLVRAIDRCLEKDRERRFANVAELVHELVPFAPERARAAISLIERVMSAGAQQLRSATHDEELASVVPSGVTPPEVSPRQLPAAQVRTTLGTAASSLSVEDRSNPLRWRWMVVSAAGIAAVVAIAVVAMRGSVPTAPASSPAEGAVVSVDAFHVAPDASVAADVLLDAPPDAAIDAARPRTPRKIAVDAALRMTIDAPPLEPARTDDKPLLPAR